MQITRTTGTLAADRPTPRAGTDRAADQAAATAARAASDKSSEPTAETTPSRRVEPIRTIKVFLPTFDIRV